MSDRAGQDDRRNRLDHVVSVRFSPEEMDVLRSVAPQFVSRFIRQAALAVARRPNRLHHGRWCDECFGGNHMGCHTEECRCGHIVFEVMAS